MITIVSKENEKVEFKPQIIEFARGLELYNQDEDIVFEEIISTNFLKALKEFYQGNEYDVEKLKMKDTPIKSKSFETNLSPQHHEIMKSFIFQAEDNHSLSPFVELIQGADMFRAYHFKDLVSYTIAVLLYCPSMSEFDVTKYRQDWGVQEKDTVFPSYNKCSSLFDQYILKLQDNYKNKINKLFNPEKQKESEKKTENDEQTLAQKIQEQVDQGFAFEDE